MEGRIGDLVPLVHRPHLPRDRWMVLKGTGGRELKAAFEVLQARYDSVHQYHRRHLAHLRTRIAA